jgi:hypothetical protein
MADEVPADAPANLSLARRASGREPTQNWDEDCTKQLIGIAGIAAERIIARSIAGGIEERSVRSNCTDVQPGRVRDGRVRHTVEVRGHLRADGAGSRW